MYTLTLTSDERAAFDWVGDRYHCGNYMSRILIHCMDKNDEWGQDGDITFNIQEHMAWTLQELAESDERLFPCFSDALAGKMMDFLDKIV